jgi:hypothetical protein
MGKPNPILEVELYPPMIDCGVCGQGDLFKWGIATYNGDIVSLEFPFHLVPDNSGSMAVCRDCFNAHAEGDPRIETYDAEYLHLAYYIGPFGMDGAGI